MSKRNATGGLVYSTEQGRMCPGCRQPLAACQCAARTPAVATDGIVRIQRETKGRNGKGVTVIRGVPLAGTELDAYARTLRQRCGSGGTVKDGAIEIQGDHVALLLPLLAGQGWKVKKSGG